VNIDVFTLFPGWFSWFTDQRHVRNAVASGLELDLVDLRATTPLRAGQWLRRSPSSTISDGSACAL